MKSRRTLALAVFLSYFFLQRASSTQAATVPSTLSYEGRMLSTSGSPITTAIVLRFSLWKSANWISSDTSGGAINTGATEYGGWYETQSVTPNTNGYFQVAMGSGTTLPTIDFSLHKYLQVEVKSSGDPDTSYVLLDPSGDSGLDAVDRKTIPSVPYAKNAESIGNRTIGTASGNIILLGPDGRVRATQMGSGTTTQNFTINTLNVAGDTTLTFGNALLPETLKFVQTHSRFEFSDDVLIQGNLTIGSGGTLTTSGSIATEGGLTINRDNTSTEATLTFGSSLGARTLLYSSSEQRFKLNDSLAITGDLTVSGRVNSANFSTLAPLRIASGAGLTISASSGSYRLGDTITNYSGATGIAVTASAVNYVFFGSGGLTVRTAAFPTDEAFIPLALVTTSPNGITSVTDRRVLQGDTREYDLLKLLTPEFDKATYQGDATNNVGTLSTSQDNITQRNYYVWTSSRSTLQDYDIFVRFLLPRDFVRWTSDSTTNPLLLNYRSTSASTADNALEFSVYDTAGSPVSLSGATTNLASTSWSTTQIEFSGNPTWTAGQQILMKFHLSAKNSFQMHIGSLELRTTHLQGQ